MMIFFIPGLFISSLILLGGCSPIESDLKTLYLAYESQIKYFEDHIKQKEILLTSSNDLSSKILFYLYRKDSDTYDILSLGDREVLNRSHFDPSKPTKVLIHGWMDHGHGAMITTLRKGFLNGVEDVNILAVDWGDISIDFNYLSAMYRSKEVGRYVGEMLDFLASCGADPASVHVIGHSLGAHVAGVVGSSVTAGKLARISGLDPALPGFSILTLARRLQKTDADFVDCIHTCGGMLGIMEPFCHADFYPNGGKFNQPGCSLVDLGKCSHFRAFEFFAESIIPSHKFPAESCESVSSSGKNCVLSQYLMGYPLDSRAKGSFFVSTNSKYPFSPIK